MNGNPIVDVTVNRTAGRIMFICKISLKDKGPFVRHEVVWYEGKPERKLDINSTILKDGNTQAYLQNVGGNHIYYLGKNVRKCTAIYTSLNLLQNDLPS